MLCLYTQLSHENIFSTLSTRKYTHTLPCVYNTQINILEQQKEMTDHGYNSTIKLAKHQQKYYVNIRKCSRQTNASDLELS